MAPSSRCGPVVRHHSHGHPHRPARADHRHPHRRDTRSPASAFPASTIVARESGREDPGHVVIDEVAGQLFALIGITADWRHAAIGLLLFRIFDILKPPPIRELERLPAGMGIMLDDVAAGLFALAVGHLVMLWF